MYIVHYITVLYVNLMYNQIKLLFKIVNPQEDLCLCILYKVPIAKKELENYPAQTESSSFDILYNIYYNSLGETDYQTFINSFRTFSQNTLHILYLHSLSPSQTTFLYTANFT